MAPLTGLPTESWRSSAEIAPTRNVRRQATGPHIGPASRIKTRGPKDAQTQKTYDFAFSLGTSRTLGAPFSSASADE